jgi:hypothetical protein
MLEYSLAIMVIKSTRPVDVSRDRSIKRVKTATLDPGLDPKETDAKSASSKSPKQTSKRSRYESA